MDITSTTSTSVLGIIGTTTSFTNSIGSALFNGFFGMMFMVLPYAIGILIFIIGYTWARRALGGG